MTKVWYRKTPTGKKHYTNIKTKYKGGGSNYKVYLALKRKFGRIDMWDKVKKR